MVPGDVQFMVATDDNRLWHVIRFADGSWGQAQELSDPSLAGITAAAAASGAAGEVQFMLAAEDRLRHTIRFADGSWQSFVGDANAASGISGTFLAVAAAAGAPGEVQFIAATDDDRLWHNDPFR